MENEMELITEQKDILDKLSGNLTDRQKIAIEFYSKDSGVTFEDLGKVLGGVSKTRASQIYNKAIRKMQDKARKLRLKPYHAFGVN